MHLRLTRRVLGLAATGLVSACATLAPAPATPPGLTQPDLPITWSIGAAAKAPDARSDVDASERLQAWWRHWPDPLLAALVTRALSANTSMAGAQAGLRQARALRDQALAGDAVQIAVGSTAQASLTRPDGGPNTRQHSLGAALDAGWEPDLFGSTSAAVRAAQATAEASRFSLADVQVSVAAETALAYLQLQALQTRRQLAADNLASQAGTLQITDWRRQAGLASELELEQARTAVAQTAAGLPALDTSLAQTRHALAVLTGQVPTALDALLTAAGPTHALNEAESRDKRNDTASHHDSATVFDLVQHIPADTLSQRPDVRQAEHQVIAAAARVDQAEAARRPSLRLSGDIGLSALSLGRLWSGPALASTLLASVSLPLHDGGAARAQVAAQVAALDQARSAYRARVLAALQEVEDTLVALEGSQRQLAQWQAAAQAAQRAAELAGQRYRSGLIDFQTVLVTQRTQLTAQDSAAMAALALASARIRLYKALGGGWDAAAPLTP